MKGKRTGIEFENHELIINDNDYASVYHLKKPNSVISNIKFINTNGILAVTGDYGNWIFCREFHPSADGFVSDGYWIEKVKTLSCQEPLEFDIDETVEDLKEKKEQYLEDNQIVEEFTDEDDLDEVVKYYRECIERAEYEDVESYKNYAYNNMPRNFDYDDVVFVESPKFWLKAVFDGFDEICRRLKENIK